MLKTLSGLCLKASRGRVGEAGQTLSGGQLRRLSLARGFLDLDETTLIAFDEPTSGLDPQSADRVIESIRGLRSLGRAVVWTTHRPSEAQGADLVYLVENERVQQISVSGDRP